MSRPKCGILFSRIGCASIACADCDFQEECYAKVKDLPFTSAEKIAALLDALKELGVDTVEKKQFDAMTREASKYKMLYDALLTLCAEQGFVPKPPKEG